jgi:hypothetical protein
MHAHLRRGNSLVLGLKWQHRHISRAVLATYHFSAPNHVEFTPQHRLFSGNSPGVGMTKALKSKGAGTEYCYGCGANLVNGKAGDTANHTKAYTVRIIGHATKATVQNLQTQELGTLSSL